MAANLQITLEVDAQTGELKVLGQEVGKAAADVDKGMDKMSRSTQTHMSLMERSVRRVQMLLVGVATMATIYMGIRVAKGFIDAAASVETFTMRLEAMLGNQRLAAEGMAFFRREAALLPFELKEVIDAGVRLQAVGAGFKTWTRPVADLAAVMGMDLLNASSAVARAFSAGAGAADMLRERGVLAMMSMKMGIADVTQLSLPKFREALLEYMTNPIHGVAGASDKLAHSWTGLLSMLKDAWFNFQTAVMDAGLFSMLKKQIEDVVKGLDQMKASGAIDELAKSTSNFAKTMIEALPTLKTMMDWAETTFRFWTGVADAIAKIKGREPRGAEEIQQRIVELEEKRGYLQRRMSHSWTEEERPRLMMQVKITEVEIKALQDKLRMLKEAADFQARLHPISPLELSAVEAKAVSPEEQYAAEIRRMEGIAARSVEWYRIELSYQERLKEAEREGPVEAKNRVKLLADVYKKYWEDNLKYAQAMAVESLEEEEHIHRNRVEMKMIEYAMQQRIEDLVRENQLQLAISDATGETGANAQELLETASNVWAAENARIEQLVKENQLELAISDAMGET